MKHLFITIGIFTTLFTFSVLLMAGIFFFIVNAVIRFLSVRYIRFRVFLNNLFKRKHMSYVEIEN